MDTTNAEPEGLEELHLDRLRGLDLAEPPHPDLPAHVASASGVAKRGRHVYVVGDESLFLAHFDLTTGEPGTLHRALEGDVVVDPEERAKTKADLEALTVLPPAEGSPHGSLLGIGSGSGEGRDRAFSWDLATDGGLHGEPREIDLSPVYDLLRSELGDLNVEGMAVRDDRLCLFHRGNRGELGNAVAELSLEQALESIRGDRSFDVEELISLRAYELGKLEGVDLCFSDATPVGGGLIVFTASAEDDESDAILGSVVGTLSDGGAVNRLREIDRRWKVEGVHATIDTGVLDLLFVCDQDDPDEASPLLGASMPLEAALDR